MSIIMSGNELLALEVGMAIDRETAREKYSQTCKKGSG